MNPCSIAAPQLDTEGDGRWNSIVSYNIFLRACGSQLYVVLHNYKLKFAMLVSKLSKLLLVCICLILYILTLALIPAQQIFV